MSRRNLNLWDIDIRRKAHRRASDCGGATTIGHKLASRSCFLHDIWTTLPPRTDLNTICLSTEWALLNSFAVIQQNGKNGQRKQSYYKACWDNFECPYNNLTSSASSCLQCQIGSLLRYHETFDGGDKTVRNAVLDLHLHLLYQHIYFPR